MMNKYKDTPRTHACWVANAALGHGSIVEIPKDYPDCDPWALAAQLEKELKEALQDLKSYTELCYEFVGKLHEVSEEINERICNEE